MSKQNCWEFKKCGKEVGGEKSKSCGVCPAATNVDADGFCDGKNGGRACVFIIGTLCGGHQALSYEEKAKLCEQCEFYNILKKEHLETINIFAYFDSIINHGNKRRDKELDM